MKYTNIDDLRSNYKNLLDDNGIKHKFVADKLEMTQRLFSKKLNTKQLDFDDISQFLDVIGYELHYEFIKKSDN